MTASLNLGILAHVDAGKTTLTEHLLHRAGVLDRPGRVDAGSTRSDSLALERLRGITIKAAVVSFTVTDLVVNLVDTPGHPDFIAEVERTLDLLDGAVLVVSAVEGVQPQTRLLSRALQRLDIPTLVFVNKTDRAGADPDRVTREIDRRLHPTPVRTWSVDDQVEVLTRHDDRLLSDWVTEPARVTPERLQRALAEQTRRCLVRPVFAGSAIGGRGVGTLLEGLTRLLPRRTGHDDAPVSGTAFALQRGAGGEKLATVHLRAGTLRVRDVVAFGEGRTAKVTGIEVFDHGRSLEADVLRAGRVGRLRGLEEIRIGDPVGEAAHQPRRRHFAPPTLETTVAARHASDRAALWPALSRLAEADPLIGVRRDRADGPLTLSLYGQVQQEIIEATLADEHGIEVEFGTLGVVCLERLAGSGCAVEHLGAEGNPFLATVGLQVEPAPVGAGVIFELEVERGAMPAAFFRAVEGAARTALEVGPHGWAVPDCRVTMTHSHYYPRQSHAHATFDKAMSSTGRDFRHLTPLVLTAALRRAGTVVCEPVGRFELEVPEPTLQPVLAELGRLGAGTGAPRLTGGEWRLRGELALADVPGLRRRLPSLTGGEGVLQCELSHHAPVRGRPPRRPRRTPDPWRRAEYLLEVERGQRLGGG